MERLIVRTSELREKDVVNTVDGRRLGYIYDLDIDPDTGQIKALVIPGPARFWIFGRRTDIEVPWERIAKIGVDVILVDLPRSLEHLL